MSLKFYLFFILGVSISGSQRLPLILYTGVIPGSAWGTTWGVRN